MKIKTIAISSFRGYSQAVSLDVKDLQVLVGKNDSGKSTILEALDMFFNEGKGCIKIDKDDINKNCLINDQNCIEISVEFTDLPPKIVIDTTNETTLQDEFLLTSSGTLKIIKRYPNAGKEKVFIEANHPANVHCDNLLSMKISELKKILDDFGFDCPDKTKSAELRKAIWRGQDKLELKNSVIEIAGIDLKNIWDQLKIHMPLFTLFQSDRKNSDSDDEVQDPMRIAVREILGDSKIQAELAMVAKKVKARLDEVAKRTLEKLGEMNPAIATSLTPRLPEPEDLKWLDVFKSVSISSDNDIPINKRGSGIKRLILFSFFRAEAERRQYEAGLPSIIYAIEEPETSQHPEHQRALIDAITSLSKTPNTQVLLTTHSPEIVKRLNFENISLVWSETPKKITPILVNELPYPSLNEVNFVAFGEASDEYHDELYGHLEEKQCLSAYKADKPQRSYMRTRRDGSTTEEQICLTEYIRHQIHHPENKMNTFFTAEDLKSSIESMREFLKSLKHKNNVDFIAS